MHGQPSHETDLLSGPLRLWWGNTTEQPDRSRNLFGSRCTRPTPDQMFRAGGHISLQGLVDRDGLHRLMGRLASRIRKEDPSDDREDNTGIPSGYTYLLQFIAHDMADTVASLSIDGDALCPGFRNARSAALLLDTLYGSGPDECPQAYEFRRENNGTDVPRTYLRLGPPSAIAPPAGYCPFRDIARSAPNSKDEGQPATHLDDGQAKPWLTEAMIADPRNDAHALISQLTILFQLLHNHVLVEIEKATEDEAASSSERREISYRRFRCARLIVTLLYRSIIKNDVLPKILDMDIYDQYMKHGRTPNDSGDGIPLEFTFGAFRFGHTMIRNSYQINSPDRKLTASGLQLSSQQLPELLPISREWFVDWARFFSTKSDPPSATGFERNFSKIIGPHYPSFLEVDKSVPGGGLAVRDFLSASYAGVLSLPALFTRMRAQGFRLTEYDSWRGPLKAWILEQAVEGLGSNDADTEMVLNDPPLPFFVLFEAMHTNGGRHLGPVGSIIVAETVLGAMKRNPLGVEEPDLFRRTPAAKCGRLFFGAAVANNLANRLSEVDDIKTMPELLEYMYRSRVFG